MWTALSILYSVLGMAGAWLMFEKAGQKGWIGLVPILNLFGLLKMIGKPLWWIVFFIPPLTPVTFFIVSVLVARRFGKSALFGAAMGTGLVTPLCMMLLGFGDARYLGPGDD